MKADYDIVIVGGGLVGASLACALRGQGWHIAVVESVPLRSDTQPSYNDRSIALAWGSRRIFEGLGLWNGLRAAAAPIAHIHITDRGHFGAARLHAREEGVEALGYVIETRAMGRVLGDAIEDMAGAGELDFLCPAQVASLQRHEHHIMLKVLREGDEHRLSARLLVAADGTHSFVREALEVPVQHWAYGQSAVIANVTPSRDHGQVAHERFTDSGPLALLPMTADEHGRPRCSLVWTVREDDAPALAALPDETFLARLQQRFGHRLGEFVDVGRRSTWPLQMIRAREHALPRVALIGNAAHTLHPIAGQGFNLGIRDVAALAEILAGVAAGGDPGHYGVLRDYASWRSRDHLQVIGFTDTLARLFSQPLLPVRVARNLALVGLDLLPPLKHLLTRQTMGLGGRLPRLSCGQPLRRAPG